MFDFYNCSLLDLQCTFEEVPNENVSTILELAILAFGDRSDIIDNGKSLASTIRDQNYLRFTVSGIFKLHGENNGWMLEFVDSLKLCGTYVENLFPFCRLQLTFVLNNIPVYLYTKCCKCCRLHNRHGLVHLI